MFNTPLKSATQKIQNSNNNFSSLRQQIQKKLISDKKPNLIRQKNNFLTNKKQVLFSNLKSEQLNQTNAKQIINQQFRFYESSMKNTSNLKNKENIQQLQKRQTSQITCLITQNNILQYESLQMRNFYGFDQWLQFNKVFFSLVEEKTIHSLWKIIRIINYGDVWIPSGLIFQITKSLKSQNKSKNTRQKKSKSLRQVFDIFLQFNKKSDKVHNFRELKMYPSIEQIESLYKQPQKNLSKSNHKSNTKYSNTINNISNPTQNVFERVYEDYKNRNKVKNENIYQSLLKKQFNQQCIFKPKINEYVPQVLYMDQTQKPQRICHSQQKWKRKNQQDQIEDIIQMNNKELFNFKASRFDPSILYQSQNLQEIPGVKQHINRKKYSESQKRRIQRFLQKPTTVFRHD